MKFHTNWPPRLTKEFMLHFHNTIIALESFQGTAFMYQNRRSCICPQRHTPDCFSRWHLRYCVWYL